MLNLKKPLSVTVGPMFSSKSNGLMARADRSWFEHSCPVVFKPRIDNRDGEAIQTHEGAYRPGATAEAFYVDDPRDMGAVVGELLNDSDFPHDRVAVFVDEVQFFPDPVTLLIALENLASLDGVTALHLYGLNLDARGNPWPTVAAVLPYATELNLLSSVCQRCQAPAHRTQRLSPWPDSGTVSVGAGQDYAPACVKCWSEQPLRLRQP